MDHREQVKAMLGRRKNANAMGSVDIIDRVRRRAEESLSQPGAGQIKRRRRSGYEVAQTPQGHGMGELLRAAAAKQAALEQMEPEPLDWRLVYRVLDRVSGRLDEALLASGKQSFSPTRMSAFLEEALNELEVSLSSQDRSALLGRVLRELCGPGSRVAALNGTGFKRARVSATARAAADASISEERGPSLAAMVDQGCLSPSMARLLELAVLCRLNVLVSGAQGTGRKDLLGAMARNIDVREQIVTVEARRPLFLDQLRVQRLRANITGKEGGGPLRSTMPELLWRALASRPNYLLVGDFPDGLQSRRVDGLVQVLGQEQISILAIADQADTAAIIERAGDLRIQEGQSPGIDLVVHLERGSGEIAHVSRISEVVAETGGRARLVDLFRQIRSRDLEKNAARHDFVATGARPRFLDRADRSGYGPAIRETLGPAAKP